MEGTLKVTPEQLISAANDFSSCGTTIRNITSNMTNTVNGLSSAFTGEDASAYIAKFKGLQDDIERLHGMIQEDVTDLNDMAKNFISVVDRNKGEIDSLPADVIS